MRQTLRRRWGKEKARRARRERDVTGRDGTGRDGMRWDGTARHGTARHAHCSLQLMALATAGMEEKRSFQAWTLG